MKQATNIYNLYSLKNGFKFYFGALLAIIVVVGLFIGTTTAIGNYTNYRLVGLSLVKLGGNINNEDLSESYSRIEMICPKGENAEFFAEVKTNERNYELGLFKLDYRRRTVDLGDRQFDATEAIYYLPESWITKEEAEGTTYEEKIRNPNARNTIRGDPTFFRGKDYPQSIPFQEIELTVDAVYFYKDTEEVGYNFIFRIMEDQEPLNIQEVNIKHNPKCEVNNNPQTWQD